MSFIPRQSLCILCLSRTWQKQWSIETNIDGHNLFCRELLSQKKQGNEGAKLFFNVSTIAGNVDFLFFYFQFVCFLFSVFLLPSAPVFVGPDWTSFLFTASNIKVDSRKPTEKQKIMWTGKGSIIQSTNARSEQDLTEIKIVLIRLAVIKKKVLWQNIDHPISMWSIASRFPWPSPQVIQIYSLRRKSLTCADHIMYCPLAARSE